MKRSRSLWGTAVFLLLSTSLSLSAGQPAGSSFTAKAPSQVDQLDPKIHLKDPLSAISDQYIVTLTKRTNVDDFLAAQRISPDWIYRAALNGFAAKLIWAEVERLAALPEVVLIEQDAVVTIAETQQAAVPTWGLDRVDQRHLPLEGSYWRYNGANSVRVYVIDTGVFAGHVDFGGRVQCALPGQCFTAINDGWGPTDCGNGGTGHGTHVAGTVGSTTYGVAKQVTLHSVRVLDCGGSGTLATVIAGVNFVFANSVRPAVANISIQGPFSPTFNTAVAALVNSGVPTAMAAGNFNTNACNTLASAPETITAGATTITDTRAGFSNFGPCLDLFAPGDGILSTWNPTSTSTATFSGTSMASPHVAGVAALYLAEYPFAGSVQVGQAVIAAATAGLVTNPGAGSPNLLLYSRLGSQLVNYTGTISTVGQQLNFPMANSWYFARVAGAHEARLTGAATANCELRLYEFNTGLGTWLQVASATGAATEKIIRFHGPADRQYYWEVRKVSGAATPQTFALVTSQP